MSLAWTMFAARNVVVRVGTAIVEAVAAKVAIAPAARNGVAPVKVDKRLAATWPWACQCEDLVNNVLPSSVGSSLLLGQRRPPCYF